MYIYIRVMIYIYICVFKRKNVVSSGALKGIISSDLAYFESCVKGARFRIMDPPHKHRLRT
jgi:hypothetical protein